MCKEPASICSISNLAKSVLISLSLAFSSIAWLEILCISNIRIDITTTATDSLQAYPL